MTNHMLETRLGQQSPSHEPYSSGEAPYDRHGLANGRGTGAARTADEPPNAPRGELLRVGDGAFVFMVPAILLSGFATPIENMPECLQTLTLVKPLRYYVAMINGVFLKEMPAAIVVQLLWPLAVIALATLSAATWLFRHRVE